MKKDLSFLQKNITLSEVIVAEVVASIVRMGTIKKRIVFRRNWVRNSKLI